MHGSDSAAVHLLANLHPAPAAPSTAGSMTTWIWVGLMLAVFLVGAFVLTSRR